MGLTAYAWQKLCNFGIMFYDMIAGALRPDPAAGQAEAFGTGLERIEPVWCGPRCARPTEGEI